MIDWLDLTDSASDDIPRLYEFPSAVWESLRPLREQQFYHNNNTTYFSSYAAGTVQQQLALIPLLLNGFAFRVYWERGDFNRIWNRVNRVREITIDNTDADKNYKIVIGIVTAGVTEAFEYFKNNLTDAREYSIGLMETPRHKIRVAVDKEHHTVFVLTSRSTELGNLIRRVYSLLPVMFNIDLTQLQYPVPDTLFKLLWRPYAEWHAAFFAWFNKTNWMDQIRVNRIKDSLVRFQRTRVSTVEKQVQQNESGLNNLLAEYGKLYAKTVELQNLLVSMRQGTSDVSDQVRFILNVPNLYVFKPEADFLRIALATPAVNYDLALIRRIMANSSSTLNERINEVYDMADEEDHRAAMRRLIELVFCEQKYVMYFNYACRVRKDRISPDDLDSSDFLGIRNPHLDGYTCWGSAGPYVIKTYNEGDLVGCLQYVINAIANMNFADSTVVRKFITYVAQAYNSPKKILQDPTTKTFYSIQEVLTRETDSTGQDNAEQADQTTA